MAHGIVSVRIKGKSFGGTPILGPLQFGLAAGESAALVGPSGIGKSTLLRIVAGIDVQFQGEITRPSALTMVFQEPNLLPWRSALQNICLCHPHIPIASAHAILKRVGLSSHADLFPGQLSVGQQRRLSLARAFVGQPQFLIMDEPFVSLDAATAESMLELTEALLAETKPATLLVTHNPNELKRLTTRTLALQGQPATLAEETL